MTDIDVKLDEKIKVNYKEPKKYKIIFLNDDTTPMDFVIEVLLKIFKHTNDSAMRITMQVHEEGSALLVYIHMKLPK